MDNQGLARDRPVLDRRRTGVLLHPTSLPSGTLGADAVRFLDFLQGEGFSAWQMLPLGPAGHNCSPYSPDSAFAGNPRLIPAELHNREVDDSELAQFRAREAAWLEGYALFTAIRQVQGGSPWWQWPLPLRQRDAEAVNKFAHNHAAALGHCIRQQYLFNQAWLSLRSEAQRRGILLYGDLPMFVVADSADVWARPHEFRLDSHGLATHVAGVPPDAFAELGQCWDNPVYDWERMQASNFAWWRDRLAHECRRFDLLRWDHFRGLVATWEIPARPGRTAADGQWRSVPGKALLEHLTRELGPLPLVAENLGIITPEVEDLRHEFQLPGMHVLQFAFDGNEDNTHLPRNHEEQGVVYTGTHDNDTTMGWFASLSAENRQQVRDVLGSAHQSTPDALVQAALDSPCRLAIIPLQDLLRLGSGARMNTPGHAQGHWGWKFSWQQLVATETPIAAAHWRRAVRESGRI
ncbi:MAG: 4-alpha-glucanotransferase [Xanthomonadales bacterium]|nr:4-alpha-glucanotransferase [Xanthomonadales bacterium]